MIVSCWAQDVPAKALSKLLQVQTFLAAWRWQWGVQGWGLDEISIKAEVKDFIKAEVEVKAE